MTGVLSIYFYYGFLGWGVFLDFLFISRGGHFYRDSFVPYIARLVYQPFKPKFFLCFHSFDGSLGISILLNV